MVNFHFSSFKTNKDQVFERLLSANFYEELHKSPFRKVNFNYFVVCWVETTKKCCTCEMIHCDLAVMNALEVATQPLFHR
jgi:hypothetical protein